jgi:hypothetical protein
MTSAKKTYMEQGRTFNPLIIIEALSSCAIEGNLLAVSMLELRDKNPREFWRRAYKIYGEDETEHNHERSNE